MEKKPENLLMIFTRNPELGKCKTRLAATVGNENALEIYKFLLSHTNELAKRLKVARQVYYSEQIWLNDIWDNTLFDKHLQEGKNLGERMLNAFDKGFSMGYKKVIIIGSDMYDLSAKDVEKAFEELDKNEFVIGPAMDGGYYLLGMTRLKKDLFEDKAWGTDTVLAKTLNGLKGERLAKLKIRNDVDTFEDIKNVKAFEPFLKTKK